MNVRQVVMTNWNLKVISLFFGTLIYFVIHSLIEDRVVKEIPVRVFLDPQIAQTFQLEQKIHRARVTLSGPSQLVKPLANQNLVMNLNLESSVENVRVGTHVLELKRSDLSDLPKKVEAVFKPASIEVELFQIYEKLVRVRPVLEFETDLKVQVKYTEPLQVRIRGPREVLEAVDEIETLPARHRIEFTSIKKVDVDLVDQINGVAVSSVPSKVSLILDVKEKSEQHELVGVPIAVLTNPGYENQVNLEPKTVDLMITGPPLLTGEKRLKDLETSSFMVFVDARGLPIRDLRKEAPQRRVLIRTQYGDQIQVVPKPDLVRVFVERP